MLKTIHQHKRTLTFVSGLLIALGFLLGGAGFESWRDIALILATAVASLPIAITAYRSLRLRAFSIELLVMIAVIGALYIREYTESSIVTFLFLFGAYLEARTLEKTRSSLKKLMEMAPQEATVLRGGETVTLSVNDVTVGERVLIKSGGKVPVDGKILKGEAHLDEAAITGEAMPVSKSVGDRVFSGSIVDHGYVEMEAEKVGDDTTFAKLIELVEEAQEAKSKAARFLDRFAGYYTPAVILLSGFVFLYTRNLHLSITFLVVACPGALVIGAPVSHVAGIGNGAKNGVLLKGGEVIERLSKVDTLVFDKTGTLTRGKPEVTGILTAFGHDEADLLQLVASAERSSEHHLARAILRKAENRNLPLREDVRHFGVIKGRGLVATVDGHDLIIGNRQLMADRQIAIPTDFEAQVIDREHDGDTSVYVAKNHDLAGIISIADQVRPDALEALTEMRRKGIKQIVMLTGDNERSARRVADQLPIDAYFAGLLPEEKVAHVKRLKAEGHRVAMAGDGINDAPAIATADIGLAMGDGGTDVSMETADVVLMADRLMQFSHAYSLAKATMRNMKQNILFALVTVLILLVGVLFEYVHLASGMFVHEASVLLVILNAMRLNRFSSREERIEKVGRSLTSVKENRVPVAYNEGRK